MPCLIYIFSTIPSRHIKDGIHCFIKYFPRRQKRKKNEIQFQFKKIIIPPANVHVTPGTVAAHQKAYNWTSLLFVISVYSSDSGIDRSKCPKFTGVLRLVGFKFISSIWSKCPHQKHRRNRISHKSSANYLFCQQNPVH